MKKAYNVTFRWSAESNTYCSNIAIAEDIEDIKVHYAEHEIISISEANNSDIDEANRKGKPIIEVEHKKYFVANDKGDIAGHDLDYASAENCLAIMVEADPNEGWEILAHD